MASEGKSSAVRAALQSSKAKRKKAPVETSNVSSDEDDASVIDVEFEWFDPEEIDFLGLKVLLRQLFDSDNDLFDLSALSDLIISQTDSVGTTVKVPEDDVETNKTDPFAILTVLNLHEHRDNPAVKPLHSYLHQRAKQAGPPLQPVADILAPESPAKVGLIISERFVNMPPQIIPPMYKMLLEELAWAAEDNEPFVFTHYLLLSKTYTEITSRLQNMVVDDNGDDAQPQKKKARSDKRASAGAAAVTDGKAAETFYFHAEDEVFARHAVAVGNFAYVRGGEEGASDAKRAFQDAGIEPVGYMMLIEAGRLEEAVKAVTEYIDSE